MESQTLTLAKYAAYGSSFNTEYVDVSRYREGVIYLHIGAASGTNPTLDVSVQGSDQRASPANFQGPENPQKTDTRIPVAFPQKTGIGNDMIRITNMGRYLRFVVTIGGTNPSFTLSLMATFKG